MKEIYGTYPQVNDAVVQPGIEEDTLELNVFRFCFWRLWTIGIVDGERQHGFEARDKVQLRRESHHYFLANPSLHFVVPA